ncbi:GRAM domain-containing protein 2A isoform X3 [Tupaia chinensis]|uniref:GRAM domain-containing protein 2A isoform X3 n=1 Tax=Tupaia chinensis TaxID=246437 RepID=UPI0003C8E0FA|nr:GRAM domain-containing protein 2A isoform X3 [Tupaia chinensis]
MQGKPAALKSPVSCAEKPGRVQEPPDSSPMASVRPGECTELQAMGGGCEESRPAGTMAHGQALEPLLWPEGLKGEEGKKCSPEGTLRSKRNQQYHRLFRDIPSEELVLKVCSCALQRDLLLQGRLYISSNWLCFHAGLFGKDVKVAIPVGSVQMIKKHKMARLLPNGLAITTNTSQKDVLIPEMKWRKVCPPSRSLSLPADIPEVPRPSRDSTDSFFPCRRPPGSEEGAVCKDELEEEAPGDGVPRLWDFLLLKVVFVLICCLVTSSCYLALRISQLERQLCALNLNGPGPGHR